MVLSLQFLLDVGPLGNEAIVAEFDSRRPGLGTQRYDFTDLKGNRLKDYLEPGTSGETSTGNPETLKNFLTWAEKKHPSQRRVLILSGHGSGTTEDFLMRDENADDFLSIDELKEALGETEGNKKLDIIGMDACYMSMAEVCYELRDHAHILIGAEGLVPEFGWPYSKFLKRVRNKGRALNAEEAAIEFVTEFVEHYEAYDTSVDLAAIKLDQMGDLKDEFASLVTALKGQPDARNKLISAHWNAQTYKSDQFVDLKDLCALIAGNHEGKKSFDLDFNSTVKGRAKSIVDRLKKTVLLSGCSGFAYQWSHGLSIYFPWAYVSPDYQNMKFSKSQDEEKEEERGTGWCDFIKELVKETRRESRYDWKPKALATATREALVTECAEVCAANGTLVPYLKSGCECAVKSRLRSGVAKRAERIVDHLEAESVNDTDIAQELRSEVSKVGRHSTRKKYATTKEPWLARREAADRAMAIKNFAPVFGVAWWPVDPPSWSVKSKKKRKTVAPRVQSQVSGGGAT